jgi:hypothetical protein
VTLTLLPPDPEDKTMSTDGFWLEEFPVAVTVTDAQGTILTMNARSRKSFEADGGAALVGTSVFECHPEPARTKTLELFEGRAPNHYTKSPGTVTAPSPASWRSRSRFRMRCRISTATDTRPPPYEGVPH